MTPEEQILQDGQVEILAMYLGNDYRWPFPSLTPTKNGYVMGIWKGFEHRLFDEEVIAQFKTVAEYYPHRVVKIPHECRLRPAIGAIDRLVASTKAAAKQRDLGTVRMNYHRLGAILNTINCDPEKIKAAEELRKRITI